MAEPLRRKAGITPGLVRISLGIEPLEDLMADVVGALNRRPVARFGAKAKPERPLSKVA